MPLSRIPIAFVGRARELALLSGLLSLEDRTSILYLGAPAGMGKSALLAMFAQQALARGRPTLQLSCMQIKPRPAEIEGALGEATRPGAPPPVILLDDFEAHARLERWYRTRLIPSLPLGTVLVFAGRNRLEKAWDDSTAAALFHRTEVPALQPADCESYAQALEIPPARGERLAHESHGVPMLMRDLMEIEVGRLACHEGMDARESGLDTLFNRLLRDVPTPDHRRALWAASLPRQLSARLLAASLDSAGTRETYRWLARRTYMIAQDDRLCLRSPYRQAVLGDLLRSAPTFYRTVLWRAGQYLLAQFESQHTFEAKQAAVGELLYMQRRQDIGNQPSGTGANSRPLGTEDVASARRLIASAAGDARSRDAAIERLREAPGEFTVTLDARGAVAGVVQMTPVPAEPRADDAPPSLDSELDAVLTMIERSSTREPPGRRRRSEGPRAIVSRVWLPSDATEESPDLAAVYRVVLSCTLSTPELPIMVLRCDPQSPLGLLVQKAGLMTATPPAPGRPPLLCRNNQQDPPIKWLHSQLAQAVSQHDATAMHSSQTSAISRTDFSDAVREALPRIGDSNALMTNPLAAVTADLGVGPGSGVRRLIKRGLDLLAASAHSRQDARRLRAHYGIDDAPMTGRSSSMPPAASPRELAVAENRLIAALWQEHVQRTRAGTTA